MKDLIKMEPKAQNVNKKAFIISIWSLLLCMIFSCKTTKITDSNRIKINRLKSQGNQYIVMNFKDSDDTSKDMNSYVYSFVNGVCNKNHVYQVVMSRKHNIAAIAFPYNPVKIKKFKLKENDSVVIDIDMEWDRAPIY